MATVALTLGTRTAFTITLNSLADQTYVAATAVDFGASTPEDVVIELELTPGTVAGNKQALLFAQISLDGTNYSTGPTSGTSATDEGDLYFIGVLPLATNATLQRKAFSVFAALGFVPRYIKPVVRNDSGAALASSGNAMNYQTMIHTIT